MTSPSPIEPEELARIIHREYTLASNAGRPDGERLDLSDVDWRKWWDDFATMPLSGPGFKQLWTSVAKAILDRLALSGEPVAYIRKDNLQVLRDGGGSVVFGQPMPDAQATEPLYLSPLSHDRGEEARYADLGRECERHGLASFAEDGSHRFQPPADYIAEHATGSANEQIERLRALLEKAEDYLRTIPDDAWEYAARGGKLMNEIEAALSQREG